MRPALALVLCAAPLAGVPPAPAAEPHGEPVRGVTLSTHTDGRDWASDGVGPSLDAIRGVGAGWVAIHPYAAIDGEGRVRFRDFDAANPPEWIARPIREAHARGLKILIKPHLAHWGSPFRWRGEIAFDAPQRWERFWSGYERWIVHLARATRAADGFCVGTELDATLRHEAAWRRVIRSVRAETDAPLTYAANWTEYERVPFWDALDAIGVQAYFPVAEAAGADETTLRAGWRSIMARLRAFAIERNRVIVFTELGYNRSHDAPVRPWDDRTDGPDAADVQRRCLRVALEAIEDEPTVVGAFLWKWFPMPRPVGRNFELATPETSRIIRDVWRSAGGSR